MALPKAKKKLQDRTDEEKAALATSTVELIRSESQLEERKKEDLVQPTSVDKINKEEKISLQKKGGRPTPYKREARMTLVLTKKTFQKLNRIFPELQEDYREKGLTIDKSFVIEEALVQWMNTR